ncbi:drug/metabolite transporter (DMT)-like permease [Phyllobacterium ifriqiyense]|uniref:Drug/metabolite transporter (DMT)-like permease n=1 Tax=Phyllobacterium ifriqiyense TaxID=314238 RepID=A0ABU0SDC3_9HYPH|nr:EamA family transporter [Phyllobacterium ifriqiyense]MDQ0998715.1 drug/metabolite transporter (DMT)-like permease [Phyllobacterium ifriqiyense]
MSGTVVLVVLFAALMHASWNAVVKSEGDKFLNTVVVVTSAGLIAAVCLPFLPAPAPESWPFLAASGVAQVIYLALVAAAYRSGDMSHAYPIMRGTAPLIVALASGPLVGEVLSLQKWIGIALICAGVLALALESRRRVGANRATTILALVNAVVIASYTLIDGLGVRHSGAPAAYTMWVFVLNAVPLLVWTLIMRRGELWPHFVKRTRLATIGGVGTLGSYGLALWAMTMAPVAAVAALRETSILFAVAISAFILKERIGSKRLAAVAFIAAGAAVMRIA